MFVVARQRKYIEPARNGIIASDACNLQKAVVSLAGAFTLRTRDGDIVISFLGQKGLFITSIPTRDLTLWDVRCKIMHKGFL